MRLELKNVSKCYGSKQIFGDVSFAVDKGQIGCLLGPSGCGKTTVLRCIAGFESIAAGTILIDGQVLSSVNRMVPAHERGFGMVFQDFALLPHLSVRRNVEFGLHKMTNGEKKLRAQEVLETVGMLDASDAFPHELSGGQQQRVALARAVAPRPRLLLLDEPFSSLDLDLRDRLSRELRTFLKSQHITALLVTHDQHESFALADEIGVMWQGSLQQWDDAYALYHRPVNEFVADFIGLGVLLPGTVRDASRVEIELGMLEGQMTGEFSSGNEVNVLLRPDDVIHDDASELTAVVANKAFRGADILYTLKLDSGARVYSLVPSHHNHAMGESIGIRLEVDHVVLFPADD